MRSVTNASRSSLPSRYCSTNIGKSRDGRVSPYQEDFRAPPRLARPVHARADRAALEDCEGHPRLLRGEPLRRDRDADADQIDAGGRARLSGAQPCAAGPLLRAAAVAPAVQADFDAVRVRPV